MAKTRRRRVAHEWEWQASRRHYRCVWCRLVKALKDGPRGGVQKVYVLPDSTEVPTAPTCWELQREKIR